MLSAFHYSSRNSDQRENIWEVQWSWLFFYSPFLIALIHFRERELGKRWIEETTKNREGRKVFNKYLLWKDMIDLCERGSISDAKHNNIKFFLEWILLTFRIRSTTRVLYSWRNARSWIVFPGAVQLKISKVKHQYLPRWSSLLSLHHTHRQLIGYSSFCHLSRDWDEKGVTQRGKTALPIPSAKITLCGSIFIIQDNMNFLKEKLL